MASQMILRSAGFGFAVLVIAPASAQNAPPRNLQEPAAATRPADVAPVAHRQPRAVDTPAPAQGERNAALQESPEDAAMNRMIRGICRGC